MRPMNVVMVILVLFMHVQSVVGAGEYCDGKDPFGMEMSVACCNGNCCDNFGQWLAGPTARQVFGGQYIAGANYNCADNRGQLTPWADRETVLPRPIYKLDTTFRSTDPVGDGDWTVKVAKTSPSNAKKAIGIAKVIASGGAAVMGPQMKILVGTALAIAPLVDDAVSQKPKMTVDLKNTVERLKNMIADAEQWRTLRINLEAIGSELENVRSWRANMENDNLQTIQSRSDTLRTSLSTFYKQTFKEVYITKPVGRPEAAHYMFEPMLGLFAARYSMEQVAFITKLNMIPGAPNRPKNNIVTKKGWRDQACGDMKDYLYGAGSLGASDVNSFPHQWAMFEKYFNTAWGARVRAVDDGNMDADFNLASVTCYHSHKMNGSYKNQDFSAGYQFVDNWVWGTVYKHQYGWNAHLEYNKKTWTTDTCGITYTGNQIVNDALTREFIRGRMSDYTWQIRNKFLTLQKKYRMMKKSMEQNMEAQLLFCDMAKEPQLFKNRPEQRAKWCVKVESVAKDSTNQNTNGVVLQRDVAKVNLFALENLMHESLGDDCQVHRDIYLQKGTKDNGIHDKRFANVAHEWECKVRCELDALCNAWTYETASKSCFLRVMLDDHSKNAFLHGVSMGMDKPGWISGFGLDNRCSAVGGAQYKAQNAFTPLPKGWSCPSDWTTMQVMWFSGYGTMVNNFGYTTELNTLAAQCAAGDRDAVRRTCESMCANDAVCTGYAVGSDQGKIESMGGPGADSCICYNYGDTRSYKDRNQKACGSNWNFEVGMPQSYYQAYIKGKIGRGYSPMPTGMMCPHRVENGYWDQRNLLSSWNSKDQTWFDRYDQDAPDLKKHCTAHTWEARGKIEEICQRKCDYSRDMMGADCVGYSVSSDAMWNKGGCLCVIYQSAPGSRVYKDDHCPATNDAAYNNPNYITFRNNYYRSPNDIKTQEIDVEVLGGTENNLSSRFKGHMDFSADFLPMYLKDNAPAWPQAPQDAHIHNGDGIATSWQYNFQSNDMYICPNSFPVDTTINFRRLEDSDALRRLSPEVDVEETVTVVEEASAAPVSGSSVEVASAPSVPSTAVDDTCKGVASEADCTFPCAYHNQSCRYHYLSGPCQEYSTEECESAPNCAVKSVDHTFYAKLMKTDMNVDFEGLVGDFCMETTA